MRREGGGCGVEENIVIMVFHAQAVVSSSRRGRESASATGIIAQAHTGLIQAIRE